MTHDSSSLTPQTSSGNRNLPLLPHFDHLLASLQVRFIAIIPRSFFFNFLLCAFFLLLFCIVFAYFIKSLFFVQFFPLKVYEYVAW